MEWSSLRPGDPTLINKVVEEYMSQGKFDNLRKQLLSEVDTKPSYQNVKQRMESTVRAFLEKQKWRPDLNKNQLRDMLKRQIIAAPFLRPGVGRIVEQLANRSSMIDLRPDLETITRDLLGINNEPEAMDTAVEPEPIDSPEDFKMVIATEDKDVKEEDIKPAVEELEVPGEEKPLDNLVVAMEILSIPPEERFIKEQDNSPSHLVKSEPIKEEPMAVDEGTEALEGVEGIETEEIDEGSDHSIINQMSPISAGTPSPPPSPTPPLQVEGNLTPLKRASEFVGKIPKLKKNSEKDNSDVKEDSKIEEPSSSQRPKNGVNEERRDRRRDRSRDRDKKSSSDRSRDKDKSKDRSRDGRRDRDRSERSKTSNDKDRSRRKDGERRTTTSREKDKDSNSHRDKSRDRVSSRERDRNRDKYKSDRSKDRPIDEKSKSKEGEIQKEEPEKDSGLEHVDNLEVKEVHENQVSGESDKIVDEGSQGSQDSDLSKKKKTPTRVTEYKLSTMTTRSKGKKIEDKSTRSKSSNSSKNSRDSRPR